MVAQVLLGLRDSCWSWTPFRGKQLMHGDPSPGWNAPGLRDDARAGQQLGG
jgi:hypothetical protein